MKTNNLITRFFSFVVGIFVIVPLSASVGGSLVIDGDLNVQNNFVLSGSSTSSGTPTIVSGLTVSYSDGSSGTNASITQIATRPSAVWNWQRLGSAGMVMQIDAANCLILSGSGTNQIILDPNNGISANGSAILTQAMANSFYLPANAGLYESNGAVGIGTDAPQATLDVSGNVRFDNGAITTDGSGVLNARAINATGSASFGGGVNIMGQLLVSNATGTGYTRLVLDQTDGPGRSAVIEFRNGNSRMYWFLDGIYGTNGGGHGQIRTDNSKNILLQSNQTSSGGVGVGAYSAVNAKFHVLGYTPSTPVSIFQGAASQSGDLTQWKNSAGTVLANITAQGRVGIGTTTPQAALDVNGEAVISGSMNIAGGARVTGGMVVTGSAVSVTSGTKIVASGSTQLLLVPEQGDLSMGGFISGPQPR